MNFKLTVDSRYGPGTRQRIRTLEKLKIKLIKECNHVTFLTKCKKQDIIPKGLCLRPPYLSHRAKQITTVASKKLVQDRLNFHLSNKSRLLKLVESEQLTLSHLIGDDFDNIVHSLNYSANRQSSKLKINQIKKFEHLKMTQSGTEDNISNPKVTEVIDDNKAVVNLSDRDLNFIEKSVLSKGPNFAITPKSVNVLDFITGIESAASQLPEETADQFRSEASTVLKQSKHLKSVRSNFSKDDNVALGSLKSDKNIKILPSDKGNATVVLNKTDYDIKVAEVLTAGKYSILTKDPTKSFEHKIDQTLRKHKQLFSDVTRSKLTPHHSKTPHMYGLPKIHKESIPLRPIVSSKNSPARELCRFLLPILKPLSGRTDSYVKNTKHFVDMTKSMTLTEDDFLVSFDVESLFTNVPVQETLNIIETRLNEDTELNNRTNLPVNVIMELLKICTDLNYFELNGQIYRQDEGMAMGSPLSPVFANIFMEEFERKAVASFDFKPKVWLRYVDDTFVIWSHGERKFEDFSKHLNTQSPNIKLTVEKEKDKQLAFLDVCVARENDGLKTTVYRKATHTGRYLNYKSNHSESVKEGLAVTLFDRAKVVCSDKKSLKEEINSIRRDLRKNGYPDKVINKCNKSRETVSNNSRSLLEKPAGFITIPYVNKLSEKIRRVARKYKIKTAFKSQNTIRQHLIKTKPLNEEQASKNCVYSIPCECNREYIGETKRPLNVRIKEHKYNVNKGNTTNSKLAKHAWDNNHRFKFEETKIIHREPHFFKRKFVEAALINLNKDPISQTSVELRPLWLPHLKDHFQNRTSTPNTTKDKPTQKVRTHNMKLRDRPIK